MWLLLLFLVIGSAAALPACASGVTSPLGGIWSEWTATGTCATSCGSCSKLFYTRKCLSLNAGYPCSGDTSRVHPCNTQTCLYPAQRTCCIPYLSMLINGSMQCGPLPKESSSTTSCCPVGGLWTQWTKFARNEDKTAWIKTRECKSEEAGCPCTGASSQERETCPCPTKLQYASQCTGSSVTGMVFNPLQIDDDNCTAVLDVQASNDYYKNGVQVRYCTRDERGLGRPVSPALRFIYAPSENMAECVNTARPFDCEARAKQQSYETLPVTFSCDLETLMWRYDYTGQLIIGYTQPSWDPG